MLKLAFPLYSRSEDLEEMRRLRSRIVRVHAVVIFPLLASFVALAPVLVPWLFGAQWEPAVVPAQILAGAGMARAVGAGTGPLMLAAGHPRALLVFNLGALVIYGLAVYFTAPLGLTAVCLAVVAVYLIVLLLGGHYLLLRRHAGISLRHLWPEVGPAAVSSGALLAVVVPAVHLLEGWALPAPVTIAVAGCLGLTVYAAFLFRLFRSAWSDLAMLLGQVLRPSPLSKQPVTHPAPSAP